ncbi:FAD binding domain-containing protein [Niveispirillum fermenti]|uniref:FAD binding domain-containing protein n=1 Tax=Niveispirillum fermenti TaxID=1233113 RepID=UPI003A8909D8
MAAQGYRAPQTMAALTAILAAEPGAMILAGGHSLLPALSLRGDRQGLLVDIGRIACLKEVVLTAAGAMLGAGVSLSAVLASPVAERYPALAAALGHVGNHVVRNRSTIGGNLAWADPRGEVLLAMIAHDAVITTSRREIPAADFVTGPFRTLLATGEVILSAWLPPPRPMGFAEMMARDSTGRAVLSALCALGGDGTVRLSVGGLADRPVRSAPLACPDPAALAASAASFLDGVMARHPVLPDALSPAYRRRIAPTLLLRCYQQARTG